MSDCELESKKLSELSEDEKADLFSYLLHNGGSKIRKILNDEKYFTIDQVKELKGIVATDQDDLLFYSGRNYYLETVKQNSKLDNYVLGKIVNATFLIAIPTPKHIQDQIDAYKNEQAKKKKLLDKQKLARKLKKAEKLLKDAGKL